jgi:hypothetical protein
MPEIRKPAMGLNRNLVKDGIEYHVQTEDLVSQAKIRTQIFVDGGRVLNTDYYSYSDHLNSTDLTSRLIKVMRACHQKVIMMIEHGHITAVPIIKQPSVIGPKTKSELWDSVVEEARRRNNHRVLSSVRPPCCWDEVVKNLKKLG